MDEQRVIRLPAPGVHLPQLDGIRGLAVDSNINVDIALSAVPPVSTYINDTPVYANMILKDLERVEVLRGPQGTLFGRNNPGGALLLQAATAIRISQPDGKRAAR